MLLNFQNPLLYLCAKKRVAQKLQKVGVALDNYPSTNLKWLIKTEIQLLTLHLKTMAVVFLTMGLSLFYIYI